MAYFIKKILLKCYLIMGNVFLINIFKFFKKFKISQNLKKAK